MTNDLTVQQKSIWRIPLAALILSAIALLFVVLAAPQNTTALSGSDFKPGNIIDDVVFYNESAMSASQIQSFLNSKVPVCDTNGTGTIYGMTRAEYGASRGNPAPYTCLKDYTESVPGVVNGGSDLCTQSISAGTKTAAQIIYDVSQACGINPQVMIVLLQKEQSLITDDWPWTTQYDKATGYGCPDTAPCDAEYFGFFNQTYQAAKAFRRYEANPNSYNYVAGRNNNIYYNPNLSGCGSSNVFIENQATANLYIYTPYQPNQAALDNLYGSGDSCSAYGNRNFWRMFNDWFGTTLGSSRAQFFAQSPYPTVIQGETSTGYLYYQNEGGVTWTKSTSDLNINPITLATSNPVNRTSIFGAGWGRDGNRAARSFSQVFEADGVTLSSDQNIVKPGQIGRFDFVFTVPANAAPGNYQEWFQPILEGAPNWDVGGKAWLQVTVQAARNTATYHSQCAYQTISAGDGFDCFLQYTNNGNTSWYNPNSTPAGGSHVTLATSNNINRTSIFGAGWGRDGNRAARSFSQVFEADGVTLSSDQTVVKPGQIGRFDFMFIAPTNAPGALYQEWFQPIFEGASDWDMGGKAWLYVRVLSSETTSTFAGQCAYPTIARGASETCFLRYRNTGRTAWRNTRSVLLGNHHITLSTSNPVNRTSIFGAGWGRDGNRAARSFSQVFEADGVTLSANQDIVTNGQIAQYDFVISVPANAAPGNYQEWFQPILEGAPNWDTGGKAWIQVTVE